MQNAKSDLCNVRAFIPVPNEITSKSINDLIYATNQTNTVKSLHASNVSIEIQLAFVGNGQHISNQSKLD